MKPLRLFISSFLIPTELEISEQGGGERASRSSQGLLHNHLCSILEVFTKINDAHRESSPTPRNPGNELLLCIRADGATHLLTQNKGELSLSRLQEIDSPSVLIVCEGNFDLTPGSRLLREALANVLRSLKILLCRDSFDMVFVEISGESPRILPPGEYASAGLYLPQLTKVTLSAAGLLSQSPLPPDYSANFGALSLREVEEGWVLQGWVENSGQLPWKCGNSLGSVRLALVLKIQSQDGLESSEQPVEIRVDFNRSVVLPGYGQFFEINLPSKCESLTLDLVVEGEFWFGLRNSESSRLEFALNTIPLAPSLHSVLRPSGIHYRISGQYAQPLKAKLTEYFIKEGVPFSDAEGSLSLGFDLLFVDTDKVDVSPDHVIEMIRAAYDRSDVGLVGVPMHDQHRDQILAGALRGSSGFVRQISYAGNLSDPKFSQSIRKVSVVQGGALFLRGRVARLCGLSARDFLEHAHHASGSVTLGAVLNERGFNSYVATAAPASLRIPLGVGDALSVLVARYNSDTPLSALCFEAIKEEV